MMTKFPTKRYISRVDKSIDCSAIEHEITQPEKETCETILSAKGENKYLFHIALWNFFLLSSIDLMLKRELSIPYFFARVDINRFFMFYVRWWKGNPERDFFVFVARMMISAGAFFINCMPFNYGNDDDEEPEGIVFPVKY